MVVANGIENLRNDDFRLLAGRRVGLLTNPSGVDRELRSTLDILWQAPQVNLVALFSPEHGLAAAAPDAEKVSSMRHAQTGLPLYSLYSDTYHPTEDMLEKLQKRYEKGQL